MDIGIRVPNVMGPTGLAGVRAVTDLGERLGYHSIWLGDHVVRPIGDVRSRDYQEDSPTAHKYTGDLFEAMVTAGYLAAKTTTPLIGFGVLVLPYRNPVLLAKMISTLDQLTDGRVVLGVGAGYLTEEFTALDMPTTALGARTEEYVRLFRALWATDKPEFHGQFVDVANILARPRPIQKRLPIWMGGFSDSALRRAVRVCDGWQSTPFVPELLSGYVDQLRRFADEEQRDLTGYAVSTMPKVLFNDNVVEHSQTLLPGTTAATPAPIEGPPAYIIEKLLEYPEVGVTHIIADVHEDDPLGVVLDAIERLFVEVVPHLASVPAKPLQ